MRIEQFVAESNQIEGIHRAPTEVEIAATRDFIAGPKPTVEALCDLASVFTSGEGVLRESDGMDVRVGTHIPPPGGPHIRQMLGALLDQIEKGKPFEYHLAYETLHPFMDGNGRTGRALWAWQMWREAPEMLNLGFLHAFYYQTLSQSRNVI